MHLRQVFHMPCYRTDIPVYICTARIHDMGHTDIVPSHRNRSKRALCHEQPAPRSDNNKCGIDQCDDLQIDVGTTAENSGIARPDETHDTDASW
jgi:hypothetical protein